MKTMIDNYSIPFEFENVYHGFAVSKGILFAKESSLRFEFQTSDNIVNILKSDIKQIDVNYLQIATIVFQKKIFSRKIIININSMRVLSQFPNSPSELILKISKENTDKAKEIINYIILKINEKKLEYLENN